MEMIQALFQEGLGADIRKLLDPKLMLEMLENMNIHLDVRMVIKKGKIHAQIEFLEDKPTKKEK